MNLINLDELYVYWSFDSFSSKLELILPFNDRLSFDAPNSYLADNQLTGTIPQNICSLSYFNISGNNWTCPLPSCCFSALNNTCGTCSNVTAGISLLCCTYFSSSSVLQSFCYKGTGCPSPAPGYTLWSSTTVASCTDCTGQSSDDRRNFSYSKSRQLERYKARINHPWTQ